MNVSMLRLQDQLAGDERPLSDDKQAEIQSHAERGARLLQDCGFADTLCVEVVRLHHDGSLDAEIVLLGDSTFEAYDHALPGLIQVATGSAVDARATGFDYYARVATVAASHAAHPPRWLVISVGERRLAPVEGDDW